MNQAQKSFILNLCLFISSAFSILWMMSGLTIGGSSSALSAASWAMFKYFTVDSNVLMGIIAFIAMLDAYAVMKSRKPQRSQTVRILQLAGTVSVTLTMMVTIFFLTPTMAPIYGLFGLFANSNFLLHLFNPLLSIFIFVWIDKDLKIPFFHTFTSVIPMFLYTCYYVAMVLLHTEQGVIAPGYDWYGFFVLGIRSGAIIAPMMVVITWVFSAVLWKLNRRKA